MDDRTVPDGLGGVGHLYRNTRIQKTMVRNKLLPGKDLHLPPKNSSIVVRSKNFTFSPVGRDELQGDFYDDFYNDELEKLGVLSAEIKEVTEKNEDISAEANSSENPEKSFSNNDESVQAEIEQFRKDIENLNEENDFDDINDYQFEDNRSNDKEEKVNVDKDVDEVQDIPSDNDDGFEVSSSEDVNDGEVMDPLDYGWNLSSESSEETLDNFNENEFADIIQNSNEDVKDNAAVNENKIIEETKEILNEDKENDFGQDNIPNVDVSTDNLLDSHNIFDETKKILAETQDTLDKDSENLGSETVQNPVEEEVINENNTDDEPVADDTVDKAFKDLMADLDKLHETFDKLNDVEDGNEFGYEESNESEKSFEGEDYEDIDDSNLEQIFNANARSNTNNEENVKENNNEPLPDDSLVTQQPEESEPIFYLHDAINANETETTINTPVDTSDEQFNPDIIGVDIEPNDLVKPLYVKLNVDEPTTITSPEYPSPYPMDHVVEWIVDGEGTGIEVNITDFAIDGHVGDHLLIKPGAVNGNGTDGILFSYTLNKEMRYRFLDVDRMFMRFKSHQSMLPMRGFSLSARMIAPNPLAWAPEAEPEPTPIPPIQFALTLHLGGLNLEEFLKTEEQFRQIIADMATMYINANEIAPGINTTLETAQIVSKAICYQKWPNSESCVEVKFGVPLVYEGDKEPRLDVEDLIHMWESYVQQDPFAVRLRMLGITEYQVPNDRGVLTVWMVIAGGVVISMAMLAFAFWRFSCFEDYSRMPSFSDTDSVNEKRKLDLYPTPHQTLPPLYAEADYKWADSGYEESKVNMGGFSNRSYLQDDMFDIDSDEEGVPGRNRDHSIRPRDIYSA